MSSNFRKVVESLPLLTTDDLDNLKDAIMDEMKARENKRVIELKEKAINALKDYYEACGSLCSSIENFYIDESQEYDDDFYHIHLK